MARGDLSRQFAAQNRKARYNYFIEDTIEAGVVLVGTEVKALREARANIGESFAEFRGDELFLVNAHISHYGPANRGNHELTRPRKLLLHGRELRNLAVKVQREGYTIVPLSIYFDQRGKAKVELAVARGRKMHDKRQREKTRDWQIEKSRLMRDRG